MLNRITLPVTAFAQNCSLVWCSATNKAALIDPGGETPRLLAEIDKRGLTLESILLTHGHLDHVGATGELLAVKSVPVIGPSHEDAFWINGLDQQAQMFGLSPVLAFTPTLWLKAGDKVQVGEEVMDVFFCPGHTPGHIVFVHPTQRLAFTGDVIFNGGVGRSDFPQGCHSSLINSIKETLLPLGDDITFVPGHGPESTFGHERLHNPYLR
ncbi:MBL fold metallo-hydrolase [Oceanisphaera sp. IT1-181]|uniref:MBL fold metallo-hydrolase n=1 Tax=Oceanisphaera sp. IT1-181 TaxID=3081199 RepID=UPI0029CA0DDD|nr:MBL fold metallo-hydrolase [Oceanisphaera sp. IT1-181]